MTPQRPMIFVVDDDPTHCVLVSELLREADYEVEVATSAHEAFGLLAKKRRPDLILLDLLMPEMDGWAFMHQRRSNPAFASIPVVVMTGGGEKILLRAPVASGYLAKPLVAERLLETVGRCISLQRSASHKN